MGKYVEVAEVTFHPDNDPMTVRPGASGGKIRITRTTQGYQVTCTGDTMVVNGYANPSYNYHINIPLNKASDIPADIRAALD